MRRIICTLFGHHLCDAFPVYKTAGKLKDEFGNIGYFLRKCERCGKVFDLDDDNAAERRIHNNDMLSAMNLSRKNLGVQPLPKNYLDDPGA